MLALEPSHPRQRPREASPATSPGCGQSPGSWGKWALILQWGDRGWEKPGPVSTAGQLGRGRGPASRCPPCPGQHGDSRPQDTVRLPGPAESFGTALDDQADLNGKSGVMKTSDWPAWVPAAHRAAVAGDMLSPGRGPRLAERKGRSWGAGCLAWPWAWTTGADAQLRRGSLGLGPRGVAPGVAAPSVTRPCFGV